MSAVSSSTNFANVNNNGNANNANASNSWVAVRPISKPFSLSVSAECKNERIFKEERKAFPRCLSTVNIADDGDDYGQFAYKHRLFFFVIMGTLFDFASSVDALYNAFQKAKRGSDWKASVQRFEMNLLPNLVALSNELRSGTYCQSPFYEFELRERGKTRHIKSLHIRDRVVQRSVCDNILVPALGKYLIYDNGASIANKGITFTRNRLQCHLERFIRKCGLNGYVLQIDYSKFFDNIRHDVLIGMIAKKLDDPFAMAVIERLIKSFAINTQHLSKEESERLDNGILDTVRFSPNPHPKPGDRTIAKSLGIGSQISQIAGVFYLTPVDQYCKTVRACKYYGRYMDDIYIIHEDKEFLKAVLRGIAEISSKLGLHINPRKTHIRPLKHGLVFMQIRYNFTPTGHISKRIVAKKVIRERRKLKAYRRLLSAGKLSRREIANAYQSWRGNASKFNARRSVREIDKLYNKLFLEN